MTDESGVSDSQETAPLIDVSRRQKKLSPQKAHPVSHYLRLHLPWEGFSCNTGFRTGTEDVTAQSTGLRHNEYCKLRDI